MRNEEERHKTQVQLLGGETPQQQNASSEQLNVHVNRRNMLKRAGIVLGTSGALVTLAIPAGATSEDHDVVEIVGLWQGVVSAQDKSFPPFMTFELYGGIWISSGQTDLTPAVLASSLWGTFKRVGHRKFRGIGRFWTYDPTANPTGFGAVDQTTTVSEDGENLSWQRLITILRQQRQFLGSANDDPRQRHTHHLPIGKLTRELQPKKEEANPSITQDHDPLEGQARFRAIPVNELIDGVTIAPICVC